MKERTQQGEKIGGGFLVMRRGKKTGRVGVRLHTCPFEHPSREAAEREAARMAEKHPGERFTVWAEQ